MWLFATKKIYENVFEQHTEDVRRLRIKVTFKNGEHCHIDIEGNIHSSIRVSNPLNSNYLTTDYITIDAREVFHKFIEDTTDFIVSDEDVYYSLKENPVRKYEVLTDHPKQKMIKVYVGTFEVGKNHE